MSGEQTKSETAPTQMTEAELEEKVARAICRAWYYCALDTPDGAARWGREREQRMAEARAAISAYRIWSAKP